MRKGVKGITLGLSSEFAKNFLITLNDSQLQFYVTGRAVFVRRASRAGCPHRSGGGIR
jgi:hypothetical protein